MTHDEIIITNTCNAFYKFVIRTDAWFGWDNNQINALVASFKRVIQSGNIETFTMMVDENNND